MCSGENEARVCVCARVCVLLFPFTMQPLSKCSLEGQSAAYSVSPNDDGASKI